MSARKELEKLRMGLARVARRAGLGHEVPGAPEALEGFDKLARAVRTQERGWNRLLAVLLGRIEELVPLSPDALTASSIEEALLTTYCFHERMDPEEEASLYKESAEKAWSED